MSTPQPPSRDQLAEQHPADVADALERMDGPEQVVEFLNGISRKKAAAALAELNPETTLELIPQLPDSMLAEWLKRMPHSKSTDIVGQLPPQRQRLILTSLPSAFSEPIEELMRYPEDTAGGIMDTRFTAFEASANIGKTLKKLRKNQGSFQEISYLYVIDDEHRLLGVTSFRDLVLGPSDQTIRSITKTDIMRLHVTEPQEDVARKFEHYHYLSLPVVDTEDRLVGVVAADEAIQIAKEEATEDMQLMVGVSGEERALTPWYKSIGKRLPWLCVNLTTAFAAAGVVALYEGIIQQWTVLAVFLPVIAGQGGNAGMQTLTIIIRDLALGELNPGDGKKALAKETCLALANGTVIGGAVGLAGYFWDGNPLLGWIVGIAMVLNQVTAALAGVLIPLTLKSLRVDPAMASSIFLTTLTDIGGFFFFLYLASLVLPT